jgi:4-hydroxy-tetrahydrodipicolinate synthase
MSKPGAAALRGVYPILATTFHDDGSIDLGSQRRLAEYLIEQGAHGLGLFGNASEGYALTGGERVLLMKEVAKAVGGRVPLVASSGHTGTEPAVELSKELEGLGADALMVLPPYLLKPDGDGLMRYFAAISNAVSIPIMVQDAPLMTGVAMPAALLARMAREIEHVRYAKVEAPPTAPKVTAVCQAAGGSLAVFGGLNGNFLIEETLRGAVGTMPGSDMTGDFVAIWDALEQGDRDTAWSVYTRILPLIRYQIQPGMGVSAAKHNLLAAGVIASARVRQPTIALDERALEELAELRARTRRP